MAECYLNAKVRFKCQQGQGVLFEPVLESCCSSVKIKGLASLTTDCKLQILGGVRVPGQCPLNPLPNGMPGPCKFVSGSWNNFSRMNAEGTKVLTSSCKIQCPSGGFIEPINPIIPKITVDNGAKPKKIAAAKTSSGHDESHAGMSGTGSKMPVFVPNAAPKVPDSKTADSMLSNSKTNSPVVAEQNIEKCEPAEEENYSDICKQYNPQKNPKCKDCEYIKTKAMPQDEERREKLELTEDEERILIAMRVFWFESQAHHIIPLNQVFNAMDRVLRAANYCGYSINCSDNSVVLPSGKTALDDKKGSMADAFEAMERTGRQWHRGPHDIDSFKLSEVPIDNEEQRRLIESAKSYVRLIKDKINIIYDECVHNKCLNDDEVKREFLEKMKDLEDEIRDELIDIIKERSDKPRRVREYYFISKPAFYFAYRKIFKTTAGLGGD